MSSLSYLFQYVDSSCGSQYSHSYSKYSIVELTITDDQDATPGETIESVLYVGFFEVRQGGIVVVGEPVQIAKRKIGTVAGFSDVHSPNHLNLLVRGNQEVVANYLLVSADRTVISTDTKLEDEVLFGQTSA
ncbi:MAG: hypothetical protein R6V83_10395 [Candidatus Thorarchaeota archaeon]